LPRAGLRNGKSYAACSAGDHNGAPGKHQSTIMRFAEPRGGRALPPLTARTCGITPLRRRAGA
jgi:hypothetical protein